MLFITLSCLVLSACSTPNEEAAEVADRLCQSLKREMLNYGDYASKQFAQEWYELYRNDKRLYKSTVAMLRCGVDNIETLGSEDSVEYRVNLSRGSFIVSDVDGDLKVTGY